MGPTAIWSRCCVSLLGWRHLWLSTSVGARRIPSPRTLSTCCLACATFTSMTRTTSFPHPIPATRRCSGRPTGRPCDWTPPSDMERKGPRGPVNSSAATSGCSRPKGRVMRPWRTFSTRGSFDPKVSLKRSWHFCFSPVCMVFCLTVRTYVFCEGPA